MARLHYRDPGTGNWVPVGTVGPAGPSAVSADANNTAVLGTDSLIFVPAPTPPVLDHGGLTGLADDDHTHYFNQTRGDARYALTGHSHGAAIFPADVAPPTIAAASAVGVSADYAREDHTHQGVQLAVGAPPALTPDIAGAVGAGTTAARDNHVHNVPAAAPITNLTATTANAEGSGASFARNDHTHAIDTAAPVALGAANAVGTATSLARSDHVHIYPTAANVGAATSGDVTTAISSHTSGAAHVALTANLPVALGTAAAGNGTTSARDNHVHPTTGLSLTGHTHLETDLPATMATEAEVSSAISTHTSGQPHLALSAIAGTALTPDIAGAAGSGSTAARADHAHNVAAAAPTTNLTASTTNSEGVGTSFARNDHSHAITANVAASADAATGQVGTSAALARADHQHPYPSAANVGADSAGTASTAVTNHEAAADPHIGYQKESEKGAVNGYAALGADGLVPLSQLPEISSGDEVLIQDTAPASQVGLDLWVDSDAPAPAVTYATNTYVDAENVAQNGIIAGVQADADAAQSTADTAVTNAATAQTAANTAQTTANNAVAKAGGTMTGLLLLSADPAATLGAATKQYVDSNRTGRNRVINGDFSVNQRAFSSTGVTGTFGFDRWRMWFSGGTVVYSNQTPSMGEFPESARAFARLATSGQAAATDFTVLQQPIEFVKSLSGKTVTASFWARAASGNPKVAVEFEQFFGSGGSPSAVTYTYAGLVTLSTTLTRYSVTVALPSMTGKTLGSSGTDNLGLNLWTSAGSNYNARLGSIGPQTATIDIWGVQVEEGTVATPYEQKSYAEELRACQRYYWRINKSGSSTRVATGWASTATQAYMVTKLPVPMRATPTIGFAAAAGFSLSDSSVLTAATGIVASAVVQMASLDTTEFWTSVTVAAGLTAFRPAALEMTPSATYIDFSAEL